MGILLSGVRMPKEHEFVYVRIYGDGYATVEDDGGEVVVATASESVEEQETAEVVYGASKCDFQR